MVRVFTDKLSRSSTGFLWTAGDSYGDMVGSNERLKQARIAAGFPSASAAARRFSWKISTYSSHENGQTPVPQDAAERYARAFKVSQAWLLTGEGDGKRRNTVLVMGRIGAGAVIVPDVEQVPADGLDEVELPYPLAEEAVAFRVSGDSMYPRYDEGDLVVCVVRSCDPRDVIGRECAVRTADGKRYLKRVAAGRGNGHFDLESHNAPPIRDVKLVWCSVVHSVVRASQWQSTRK